jgi:hypothetical protein
MAQTKPKAGQFYGVSNNGTDGQFLQTDGTGGMAWANPITAPTITSLDYPGSATSADTAGGENIIINGTEFITGITCEVGGTSATTTLNSATQITIVSPAKAAGQYNVTVTNTNGGTATSNNLIQYSGVPIWTTNAGSLGSVAEGGTTSFQVTATEGSDTIEYAITSGSLPSGYSLATATGAITGTAAAVTADTTSTFSITATDDENQTSSARSFSITVTNIGPSQQYETLLYTGDGSSGHAITGASFTPDFVWIKPRTQADNHNLYDTIRGPQKQLIPNSQAASTTQGNSVQSFDSGGFTTSTDNNINNSGIDYVAWCLKAGGAPTATNSAGAGNVPTLGSVMVDNVASTSALAGNVEATKMSVNTTLDFSMVTFTSLSGSSNEVPHGLSGTPDLFIFKRFDTSGESWWVYTQQIDGSFDYLALNSQSAKSDSSETAPTSTTVYQPTSSAGREYMLYCWKNKAGFSKVGGYVATGSAGTPIIETGFKPAMVLLKNTARSQEWIIIDAKRGNGKYSLIPDSTSTENTTGDNGINIYENGFSIASSGSGVNYASGDLFLYLALAADPSGTTPSLANSFDAELFDPTTSSSALPVTGMGFKPDFVWAKYRDGVQSNYLVDSVRGLSSLIYSDRTDAAYTASPYVQSFDADGITYVNNLFNRTGTDACVSWGWKAGGLGSINTDGTTTSIVSVNQAAGFSIVEFIANSTTPTVGHGLTNLIPDLIILKATSFADSWFVNSSALTNQTNRGLRLNQNSAEETNNAFWNNIAPTSSTFSVGNGIAVSGSSYIAYCFKSISNFSKIGSYSGTGSSNAITGLGFQPSWVMIKCSTANEDWAIFDASRGANTFLVANSSGAEQAFSGFSFDSDGFTVPASSGMTNGSGQTYIYAAFKIN